MVLAVEPPPPVEELPPLLELPDVPELLLEVVAAGVCVVLAFEPLLEDELPDDEEPPEDEPPDTGMGRLTIRPVTVPSCVPFWPLTLADIRLDINTYWPLVPEVEPVEPEVPPEVEPLLEVVAAGVWVVLPAAPPAEVVAEGVPVVLPAAPPAEVVAEGVPVVEPPAEVVAAGVPVVLPAAPLVAAGVPVVLAPAPPALVVAAVVPDAALGVVPDELLLPLEPAPPQAARNIEPSTRNDKAKLNFFILVINLL